jgi:hypothetical protein
MTGSIIPQFLVRLPVRDDVRHKLASLGCQSPDELLGMFRAVPRDLERLLGASDYRRAREFLEAQVPHADIATDQIGPPFVAGGALLEPSTSIPVDYRLESLERDDLFRAYQRMAEHRGVGPSRGAKAIESQIKPFLDALPRLTPTRESAVNWLLPYILVSPYRVAPERAGELHEIMQKNRVEILFANDSRSCANVDLERRQITFGVEFAERLWALAYAGLEIIELVGRKGLSGVDAEIPSIARATLLEEYLSVREGRSMQWPSELPPPSPNDERSSLGNAATELFLTTSAWVLLHEIGHVCRGHRADDPPGLWQKQEFEADDWSAQWMLTHWKEYGARPDDRVFVKRTLGAVLFLAQSSGLESLERTRGGNTHPDPVERLLRFLHEYVPASRSRQAGRNELAWYAALILVQIYLTAAGKSLPHVEYDDAAAALDAYRGLLS